MATSLLFTTCYIVVTGNSVTTSFQTKNERSCVSKHIFNANPLHKHMQLKLRYILINIRSVPNEIKLCKVCISNVTCGSVEIASGATGVEFITLCILTYIRRSPAFVNSQRRVWLRRRGFTVTRSFCVGVTVECQSRISVIIELQHYNIILRDF